MDKKEILDIINEPSKHIQIAKVDGKDKIVYSSKFVELLELIPNMLTKDETINMLAELHTEIDELPNHELQNSDWKSGFIHGLADVQEKVIQKKIDKLRSEKNDGKTS